MVGYRVKYTDATKLVAAVDELVLSKTIARYGRVDLLMIDELGYMPSIVAGPSSSSKS